VRQERLIIAPIRCGSPFSFRYFAAYSVFQSAGIAWPILFSGVNHVALQNPNNPPKQAALPFTDPTSVGTNERVLKRDLAFNNPRKRDHLPLTNQKSLEFPVARKHRPQCVRSFPMAKFRSRVYVDKTVQGALAKRMILHWAVFFLLCALSLFTLEYFRGNPELSMAEHLHVVWGKYAFFFILMLAIMPTFIYDAMKLSNRFAGPILRLKESLKNLADGKKTKNLKFRDNDFWIELSEDFNRVAERVHPTSVEQPK
jgi:hypothetical protein